MMTETAIEKTPFSIDIVAETADHCSVDGCGHSQTVNGTLPVDGPALTTAGATTFVPNVYTD